MESYTFNQIKQKYGWNYCPNQDKMIEFALNHGVVIEIADTFHKKMLKFNIIDDSVANYEWKVCPIAPKYEVCKEGLIRNAKNKKIWNGIGTNGYVVVTEYETRKSVLGHRMIMETFNPIENSQDYMVDHINGKKTDNRLENLRWVSSKGNQMNKIENWNQLTEPFQELLQLVGYNKMVEILEEQIKNWKKQQLF